MRNTLQFDNTPPPKPQLSPSLATLPPEIKALIVEQITRRDLNSVSRINTEFSALARLVLWTAIELRFKTDQSVSYLFDTVLSRDLHLVRSLTMSQLPYGVLSASRHQDDAESDATSFFSQHNILIARILPTLPMLVTVHFTFNFLPRNLEDYSDDPGRQQSRISGNVIPRALAAVGNRLETLILRSYSQHPISTADLSGGRLPLFLSHFPLLSSLSLDFHLEKSERESLRSAIASLRHLKRLDVQGCDLYLFDGASDTTSWQCPLEVLSLATREPISSLVTLLNHFSSTLTTLSISMARYSVPTAATTLLPTPFSIPHLRILTLDIAERALSLAAFRLCPLEQLAIGRCPLISSAEWEAFVDHYAATLRRVTVSTRAEMPSLAGTIGLYQIVPPKGVELVLESDEEEDSDGESRSDSDGYSE